MVDFELKHTGLLWLQRMVLACLLCVVGFTHAETATATDVDAETVVVGKILKDQQSATQKKQQHSLKSKFSSRILPMIWQMASRFVACRR